MSETSPFCWPVTIYYEDTDIGGVVYHANYLKFFERARTEFLRSIGVNQHSLLRDNIGFVVHHMDIDFIKGATLDDMLVVESSVQNLRRASLTFLQQLVSAQGIVYCRAEVKIACVNTQTMKPIVIPTSIQSEILRER